MNNKIDYSQKVLEVKDLKQQFRISRKKGGKIYAIDGISFDIYKREVFGLVGESGCGKTTTGRTIIKLYQPTDGTVNFNGYSISQGYYENTKIIRRAKVATRKEIREATPLSSALYDEKTKYKVELNKIDIEIEKRTKQYESDLIEKNKGYIDYKTHLIQLEIQKENDLALVNFNAETKIKEIKTDFLKTVDYETKNTLVYAKKRMVKKISSIKISPINKEEKQAQITMAKEQYKQEVNLANQNKSELYNKYANKSLTSEEKEKNILMVKSELEKESKEILSKYKKDLETINKEYFAEPISKEEKASLKQTFKAEIKSLKERKKVAKKEFKTRVSEIKKDKKQNPQKYLINHEVIAEAKNNLKELILEQRKIIKEAKRVSNLSEKPEVISERKTKIANAKKIAQEKLDKLNSEGLEKNSPEYKEKSLEIRTNLKTEIKEIEDTKITYKKVMKSMQMIFQDPISSLDPRMTVHDIIAEGLVIQGVKDKEYISNKVKESLELVGLTESHSSRYIHEFSGGQRQRIGIARALVVEPEFIIADEPISALDVSIQAQVINLLTDLKEKLGLTILFIAHDLSVVKYFSDRIAVMYRGKIIEMASAVELFENPIHPYTKSLLSAIPQPDPVSEENRLRAEYDPSIHDYREDKPEMIEIKKDHFIYANKEELVMYKEELKKKGVK